jgi:hypothetical protein
MADYDYKNGGFVNEAEAKQYLKDNNMYDFGEAYRKQFLEDEKINRKHERQAYWLLLITSLYVIIHMSIYLYRTYL